MIDIKNDPEGKEFFKRYLQSNGFEDINTTSKMAFYDMYAKKDGITYFFELKYRPITSTQWGDSIIESIKYDKLKTLGDNVYVVNFFTDCFHIHKLDSQYQLQEWMCQKTNNWDRHKVRKVLVSYTNTDKTRRGYF